LIAAGSGGVPYLCDRGTLRCTAPLVVQGVGATQAKMLDDGSLLLADSQGQGLQIAVNEQTGSVHRFDVVAGQEILPALNPLGPQQPYVISAAFVSA